MSQITTRQEYSKQRLAELRQALGKAEEIAASRACVYATGSYGRIEASEHSDLDVFIVGESRRDGDAHQREFSQLDEICLKAELINVSRRLGFQDFSGDGEYLIHYPKHRFIENLGKQHDDSANTFTARLLLLLESQCLVGKDLYERVRSEVLEAYWRDFKGHEDNFVPGFLVNDILRLWRTFCVNYEANTQSKPEPKKAKRQLKHYKLQHSRLLTCFSGIIHLLSVFAEKKTVTLEDAKVRTHLTPLERIEQASDRHARVESSARQVLSAYEEFLRLTATAETVLIDRIMSDGHSVVLPPSELNTAVYELIQQLGEGNRLHQQVVV